MATTSQDPSLDPAQAALLARVEPAVLEEQALVTNNRDFNWVTNKSAASSGRRPIVVVVCMAVALATAALPESACCGLSVRVWAFGPCKSY